MLTQLKRGLPALGHIEMLEAEESQTATRTASTLAGIESTASLAEKEIDLTQVALSPEPKINMAACVFLYELV